MTAEIISVGTELLLGNIVNTNAAYLAEQCAMLGLSVYYQSVVGDNAGAAGRSDSARPWTRSDIVFLSGVSGLREDDLTKEIAAKACGQELVEDAEAKERLTSYFTSIKRPMTENNLKQAMVPGDCTVLYNKNGTAPGMVVNAPEDKKIILLPGPPGELIPMFHEQAEPILSRLQPGILYSKVVKIDCLGESYVETQIMDLIDEQSNPTVAPYAKLGEVHLRVTAKADSEDEAKELVMPMVEELKSRFGG